MIATALDTLSVPPSSRLLGWQVLDARPEEGWIRIGFEARPEFCNPGGFIQGGLLCAMLDDTMGPAVFIRTEGRHYMTTIGINMVFLAPARVGRLIGEGWVVKLGSTIAFAEGRLEDAAGNLLATATASMRLLDAARSLPSQR